MNSLSIFKRTSIFCMFSFSMPFLAMDMPKKKSPKKVVALTVVNHEIIEWDNLKLQQELSGTSFAYFSKDLLFPMLAASDPSAKNGLRKTNKFFWSVLSWEKMQPCILSNKLNVAHKDIENIITQIMDSSPTEENHDFKMKVLENIGFNPTKDFLLHVIPGYFGKENLKIMVTQDVQAKITELHDPNFTHGACSLQEVSPFIKACMVRNSLIVQKYFCNNRGLQAVDFEDFKRVLPIIIYNDDLTSLEEIFNNVKIQTKDLFSIISESVQLAIMQASPKVLSFLNHYYSKAVGRSLAKMHYFQQKDFIGQWLNVERVKDNECLYSIIKAHHDRLAQKHKNNFENYRQCLNILGDNKSLKKIDSNLLMNNDNLSDNPKNQTATKKSRIINCSIM